MTKNITLSADDALIQRARDRARSEGTTLNALFRTWLERYVGQARPGDDYERVMESLAHVESGGPFTRDDMNER
jgi:hypothetical protein